MTSSDGAGERPATTLPGYRTAQDVAGEEAVQRERLTMHLRISHRLGTSPAKVIEVLAHTGACAGFPRALNAVETAKRFYGDLGMLPLEQQQH
ncbi:carboxymuconolactone decarboxylase family protein [Streptomyces cyaneogriseus]|uniref:carboxymuconolactone decarboxylase family protein n=1 Tax=Streptomyces cyaneogriseus TaxID=68192 RepID=UPI00099CCF29|nr:carboxymuconolactone decarboxylase family protein [Streptomyces cyaneogriseus]